MSQARVAVVNRVYVGCGLWFLADQWRAPLIKCRDFSIQPSEMSKLALAIFLAYFLEKRVGEEREFWRTFIPCGVVTALLAGLIVVEPDFGTSMMLAVMFLIVIYTAGRRTIASGDGCSTRIGCRGWLVTFCSLENGATSFILESVG